MTTTVNRARWAGLLAVAAVSLAGCASTAEEAASTDQVAAQADAVTIVDPWVKSAESGMTAAFGDLVNDGDADATVVSVTTDAATMLELHETAADDSGEMMMSEVDGGFVIPAGGEFVLEPSGYHIMLMDLVDPLEAGEQVTFTLTFADDSTMEFTADVKDYAGANEEYAGDSEMDMDDEHEESGE